MDITQLQLLLKQYHLSPNKIRGQNFLVSDEVLKNILDVANISKKELVLEVGPGLGALTTVLVDKAEQVVAFEIDKNFVEPLNKLKKVSKNLEIIWHDILSLSDDEWLGIMSKYKKNKYKIVANIPYYLTAKFINKFILAKRRPLSMTLMVQKEVAQRVVDHQKHSLLSLSVAFYAKAQLAHVVTKENFYPQPKVDSAILNIYDIIDWQYQVEEKKVWQLVRRGFAYKRKKLFNNLLTDQSINKEKLAKIFDKMGLDQNIRAEKLSVSNWLELAKNLF
ncbi:ribosomal RNA small subunit methyltransferase A [Patescibacteria group bacterium]|nr:ribosomal RNA small subunit methyltransferase A [Patescibacteria group bacterium]